MTVLGLGHDVVDVNGFASQLAESGSRMRALFSTRELRQATGRAQAKGDGEVVHLAAKWAGKEAVLKAWEEALGERPSPYTLDNFPWSRIEILDDGRGRPHVTLDEETAGMLHRSLGRPNPSGGGGLRWHISLTHDGPVASAVALLEE